MLRCTSSLSQCQEGNQPKRGATRSISLAFFGIRAESEGCKGGWGRKEIKERGKGKGRMKGGRTRIKEGSRRECS